MKLLYIAIISFIFISTFALSITKIGIEQKVAVNINNEVNTGKELPPIPILKNLPEPPTLTAESIYAVDVTSGVSLYEKNPDERLFPASTTKMITALTSLDYYNLDTVIKVGNVKVAGQKMGLKEGEEISIRDLLYGLLIYSANDAAEVLAGNYCSNSQVDVPDNCGRDSFIKAMNEKAVKLHLTNTNFENPSGLDSTGHLTTARDLTRIAIEGMKNPFFSEVVGTKEAVVTSLDGKFRHKLVNLNQLLGEVNGVLGIKTGWTEKSKENLVTYINRDDKKVIIVILGSQDRFDDTKKIIDYIFENYEWKKVRI